MQLTTESDGCNNSHHTKEWGVDWVFRIIFGVHFVQFYRDLLDVGC